MNLTRGSAVRPERDICCFTRCVPWCSNGCILLPSFSSRGFETMTRMTSPMRTIRATPPFHLTTIVASSAPRCHPVDSPGTKRAISLRRSICNTLSLHADAKTFAYARLTQNAATTAVEQKSHAASKPSRSNLLCDTVLWVVPYVPPRFWTLRSFATTIAMMSPMRTTREMLPCRWGPAIA